MTRVGTRCRGLSLASRILGGAVIAWIIAGAVVAAVPAAADEAEDALNISIGIFDPGVPADDSVLRELEIFPRIRRIETRLLPFRLRETLVGTGEWGAVRVVREPDAAAELGITGRILRSDGDLLELEIRAEDATGRLWFEAAFSARAAATNDPSEEERDGNAFHPVYARIADALANFRRSLEPGDLRAIQNISLMRYAADLAPSSFAEFIEREDDGSFTLLRLPATNDPMLRRIELIRNTEFLITDTVDSKFRELNADIAKTYRVWREYRLKYVGYQEENLRFAERNIGAAPRGTWEAIKDQYDAYKYDRVTVQEQDRLAVAFDNEVRPAIEAMEDRVAELEGWVEQGYAEWRRLLEELDEVETYLGE